MITLNKKQAQKDLTDFARRNGMTFKKVGNNYVFINRKTKEEIYSTIDFWIAYEGMMNGSVYQLAEMNGAPQNVVSDYLKDVEKTMLDVNDILNDGTYKRLKERIEFVFTETRCWDVSDIRLTQEEIEEWKETKLKEIQSVINHKLNIPKLEEKAEQAINQQAKKLNEFLLECVEDQ